MYSHPNDSLVQLPRSGLSVPLLQLRAFLTGSELDDFYVRNSQQPSEEEDILRVGPGPSERWFFLQRWVFWHSRPTTQLRGAILCMQERRVKRRYLSLTLFADPVAHHKPRKGSRNLYTSQPMFDRNQKRLRRRVSAGQDLLPSRQVSSPISGTNNYEYCALPTEHSFRCLDLAAGEGSAPLQGTLVILPIGQDTFYEAISYKWTAPEPKATVRCNGKDLLITAGVSDMLLRLRLPNATRRLWIDSICINQKNDLEKGSQVNRMDEIYKNAGTTTIWLGEENSTTPSAFDLLHTLTKVVRSSRAERLDNTGPTFEDLCQQGLPNADDERWRPLESLLHHPWFTRTWILQEVTLSKVPWVQCGSHRIEWNHLADIVYDLATSQVDTRFSLLFVQVWQVAFFKRMYLMSTGTSLLQLLWLARFTSAKLAKDRVFAVLGVASDQQVMRGLLEYGCSACQSRDAERVFTDTAMHYLREGHMEILNFASDPSLRSLQRLPSWVPDWSTDGPAINLILYMSRFAGFGSTTAHRSPTVYPKFQIDTKTLVLRGLVNDKIRAVGIPAWFQSNPYLKISKFSWTALLVFEQWRHLSSTLRNYPTQETLPEAFARTLILGRNVAASGKSHAGLFALYALRLGVRIETFNSQESYSNAEFHEYYRMMMDSSEKRTFFVTANGYMGLGPCFLRPGDSVAHIDGGSTPFIIRKKSKTTSHRLVGDAYIHGLMDFELPNEERGEIRLV